MNIYLPSYQEYQDLGGTKAASWNNNNNWEATGVPAKKGLLSLAVDSKITQRRLYVYLWVSLSAGGPPPPPGYFICEINFYLNNAVIHLLPITLVAADLYPPGQYKRGSRSWLSGPVAGGIAAENTLGLNLYARMSSGQLPQPDEVRNNILQPYETKFATDRIDFDVLGWAGYDPTNMRAFIASVPFAA